MKVIPPDNRPAAKWMNEQTVEILYNALSSIQIRAAVAGKTMVEILALHTSIELFNGRIFACSKHVANLS